MQAVQMLVWMGLGAVWAMEAPVKETAPDPESTVEEAAPTAAAAPAEGTAAPATTPTPSDVATGGAIDLSANNAANVSNTPPGQPKRLSKDRQPLVAGPVLGL